MRTYEFGPEVAALVASGQKRQTIRRLHSPLPEVGERLELYQPHPTLQRQLIRDDVACTSVQPIRIYRTDHNWTAVELDGEYLILVQIRALALADGFASTLLFLRYFEKRGLPFEGVLIKWVQRPENPHSPPPARECGTCRHDGKSLEDWPCRTSLSMAGLMCWEPKEAKHGL